MNNENDDYLKLGISSIKGLASTLLSELENFEDYQIFLEKLSNGDVTIKRNLLYFFELVKWFQEDTNFSDLSEINIFEGEIKTKFANWITTLRNLPRKQSPVYTSDFTKSSKLGEQLSDKLLGEQLSEEFFVRNFPWVKNEIQSSISTTIDYIRLEFFNKEKVTGSRITNLRDYIDAQKSDVDITITDLKSHTQREVIASYSEIYTQESNDFSTEAKVWLSRIGWCIAVIVCLLIVSMLLVHCGFYKNLSQTEIIQVMVSKAVILSTCFYALSICNKNYKASKHNQIVNKYKANALASFEAFVKSSKADDATKRAVLLEATKTIYSEPSTGYASPETEDSSNKIIEVIQNAIPKS